MHIRETASTSVDETNLSNRPVSDLLNDGRRELAIDKVRSLFLFETANLILTQIVGPSIKPNWIYWPPRKTGEYNIKFGYF